MKKLQGNAISHGLIKFDTHFRLGKIVYILKNKYLKYLLLISKIKLSDIQISREKNFSQCDYIIILGII